MQVRDSITSKSGGGQELAPAVSAKNKEHVRQMEQQLAEGGMDAGSQGDAPYHEALLRMARRKPYYERNRPKLCTFFARGECNRGDECPFVCVGGAGRPSCRWHALTPPLPSLACSHEMPRETDDPLRKQNIRDRFAGTNDPVAAKILGRIQKTQSKLSAPRDSEIKTLWAGGLDAQTTEQEIRCGGARRTLSLSPLQAPLLPFPLTPPPFPRHSDAFYAYGELKRVRVMAKQRCAFIEYTTREAAEAAADALHRSLSIRVSHSRTQWGLCPLSQTHAPSLCFLPPVSGRSHQDCVGGQAEARGGWRQGRRHLRRRQRGRWHLHHARSPRRPGGAVPPARQGRQGRQGACAEGRRHPAATDERGWWLRCCCGRREAQVPEPGPCHVRGSDLDDVGAGLRGRYGI